MVAGAGGDHHERQVALRGHGRDEGLGAVASRDAEQVGARVGGPAGERGHVLPACHVQDEDLRAECLGLLPQPEPGDLAAARARIHDQVRSAWRRHRVFRGPCRGGVRSRQRDPAAEDGQRPQRERDEHHPQQSGRHVEHHDGDGGGDGQYRGQDPDRAGVHECPPHARRRRHQPGRPQEDEERVVEPAEQKEHGDRPRTGGQCQACGPAWAQNGIGTGHDDLLPAESAGTMPSRLFPVRHPPCRAIPARAVLARAGRSSRGPVLLVASGTALAG